MALAGNVVHFHADPVGILEQDRVVAGSEVRAVLGRMNDPRVDLIDQESMDGVDVLAAAGAKAEVMEAGAILIETLGPLLPCGAPRTRMPVRLPMQYRTSSPLISVSISRK